MRLARATLPTRIPAGTHRPSAGAPPRAMRLILASQSPRRRELLRRIVSEFEVIPGDVDETLEDGPVADAVTGLALRKARAVAGRARVGVVLAADTVVVIDGMLLGKPVGSDEARGMLVRLRGRQHEVITGVAVVDAGTGRAASTTAVSRVLMAAYPDATIAGYVASGSPFDKAGGYAIQEHGELIVAGHTGSFTNIIGLPLESTKQILTRAGLLT